MEYFTFGISTLVITGATHFSGVVGEGILGALIVIVIDCIRQYLIHRCLDGFECLALLICLLDLFTGSITRETLVRDIHLIGLPILRRTEDIIRYLKPRKYFIENPATGRMKDFVSLPNETYTLDYCAYSDWGYRKRTNVFTNVRGFQPQLCAGFGVCPNTEGGHVSFVRE